MSMGNNKSDITDIQLKKLWNEFKNVLLINNGNGILVLSENWNGFNKGISRNLIYKWFDERYNHGLLNSLSDKELEELWDELQSAPFEDNQLGIHGMFALTDDWLIFKKGMYKHIIQSWIGRRHSKGENWLIFGYEKSDNS